MNKYLDTFFEQEYLMELSGYRLQVFASGRLKLFFLGAGMDLSRICSVPLTWYFASKENGNGKRTQRRIQGRCERIALTSGLTRRQVASDLGIGVSTLKKWIKVVQDSEDASLPDADLVSEVERLRKENAVLKQEREILKKRDGLLCESKIMRFAFIDRMKKAYSIELLCRVLKVTSRGLRAWRLRSISQRQRDDMVLLAYIREQHRLSLGSYGRPRMTEELKELGFNVGHRRVPLINDLPDHLWTLRHCLRMAFR